MQVSPNRRSYLEALKGPPLSPVYRTSFSPLLDVSPSRSNSPPVSPSLSSNKISPPQSPVPLTKDIEG